MATLEERTTTFIRPDGKEKVTGLGRYTADLNVTGQLHGKFRYADHTHARIVQHRRVARRGRCRACSPSSRTRTSRTCCYGGMVQDRRLFAKDIVRWEADVIAGVAALTEEIADEAVRLIEVEYEPLQPVTDIEAAMADAAPLVHEGWEGYEADDNLGRDGQHARLLDHRQGRRRRRDGDRRRRRQGPLRRRRVAGRADRAARADRAVERRSRHGLELDPGAVRGALGRRPHAADPRVARAHRRAAARRRLRLQVRLPLRGARRRACPALRAGP